MKTILFLFILFQVCMIKVYPQIETHFKMNEFPKEINLEGQKIKTDLLLNPMAILLIGSNLYIKNNKTEFFFDILNIYSGKIIKKFGRNGRGPGEIIAPWFIQYDQKRNQIYMYDIVQRKLNFYSPQALFSKELSFYIKSFFIDSVYVETPVLMKDDCFFCTLLGDYEGNRFCKIDLNGKFINKFGTFPDIGKDYPTAVASNVFVGWVDVSPDMNKLILAYDTWDRIEILNPNGEILITITGPQYKMPEIAIEGENVSITSNNPQTYYSTNAGPDSFMVLYSGRKVLNQRIYKTIVRFDYNGKPLVKYNLDPAVYCIAVDWENRLIYGINNEMEPFLCKFKF